MSRSIVLSNGELCVALDNNGLVRDLYYPHVGLEDHVRGHYIHRIGVYIDGELSWLGEGWEITVSCDEDSLASNIYAKNPRMQVELTFNDVVYNEKPIFVRKISIKNLAQKAREIKLYLGHQFEIAKSHGGETAYYDPVSHCIIHYKGRRVFLASAALDNEAFNDFAIGIANFQGHAGTHRDAEDGHLSQNAIEHGPVDSVIGLYEGYAPEQTRICYYWIAAAQTIPDAHALNEYCRTKTGEHLVKTTRDYWKAWANAYEWSFYGMDKAQIRLFKQSLMCVRAHVDIDGGILASVDSDMLQYGLDTYSYVWPRDGAFSAMALDKAGDSNVSKRFFEFCKDVISGDGYLLHKYLPDRSLGSSWHPWIKDGKFQLPIQEDETSLVIIAMLEHYRHSRDLEFLESMYVELVETAANFFVEYRDQTTKLPLPSYDLWEEKRGTSTFTASSVYGALSAAAELSKILGKTTHEEEYRKAAEEVRQGILKYLWNDDKGFFLKMVNCGDSGCEEDPTIDISSAYGVFAFGVLPCDDPRLVRAFDYTVRRLSHGISTGGLARYEGDDYYRVEHESAGNPWITTTLWYAEYLIARAKKQQDLVPVLDIFSWVVRHAQPSGVLAEQMHPVTGEQFSAAPLTWSHAAYVSTVLRYLDKLEELGICMACNPAP